MTRLPLVLLVLLAGCSTSGQPTLTAPTPVQTAASVSSVPAAPDQTPEPIVNPGPPVAVDAPIPVPVPGRAFVRTDCDWGTLSAIRCYNPSDSVIVLTAALNTLDCGTSFGAQTVTIPPRTNGYFTLSSPACEQTAQIDVYVGSRQGSCRAPDFTSQRTYAGPACPPPPPPPPPPPCVEPAWGPWTLFSPVSLQPSQDCHLERRERTTCVGAVQVEFRTVCTEGL